jgi:glycerol kinase
MVETTAIGAAFLAGLQMGYWKNSSEIQKIRRIDKVFRPRMKETVRKHLWNGWKEAVGRVLLK